MANSNKRSKTILQSSEIEDFFKTFEMYNDRPTTELSYKDNYTLLIAVVLSARTTDVSVNKITPKLFELADTPQKMVQLGEEKISQIINSIGFYKTKAKRVCELSQQLIERYNSIVPNTLEDLITLSGVGRKTANVVLNVAFGKSVIAVDTHVFRVANRVGLACGKTPEEIEQQLYDIVPQKWIRKCNCWLVLHGRYICKSQRPKCAECPVNKICKYDRKKI